MPGHIARAAAILAAVSIAATSAEAQTTRKKRERAQPERSSSATPADKRDSVVAAPGSPYNGRAYWQVLGHCGGVYFKLSTLYTEIAVRARAVKPNPKIHAEYAQKLDAASKVATVYYVAAERFLVTDRGLDRAGAIMTYDVKSREASARLSTIEAALAATRPCPALYQVCREAYPKICTDTAPAPMS
jgi:hypothetical protein